jgi:integrase
MSIDDVLYYIEHYKSNNEVFRLDFIQYANKIADELKATGHNGNSHTYITAANSLKCFLGADKLDISEITVGFLRDYKKWLQTKPARKNRPDKETGRRSPSLYLSTLRAIHNRAKDEYNDEDAGIINIPLSPFKKVGIPPVPVSRKRALTKEQFTGIMQLPYEIVTYRGFCRWNLAKDIFLLSFGLMGMNAADLFSCTKIDANKLTYNREKTKNRRADAALMIANIQPEIIPLVEKYRDKTGERVFCFHKYYSNANTFTFALNKGLKMIGEKMGIYDLEFYAARHTWATLATNKVKIEKSLVHEALNHVNEKMKVTDIYIEKDWERINNANKKVINYVKLMLTKESVKETRYQKKFNLTKERSPFPSSQT